MATTAVKIETHMFVLKVPTTQLASTDENIHGAWYCLMPLHTWTHKITQLSGVGLNKCASRVCAAPDYLHRVCNAFRQRYRPRGGGLGLM